MNTFGIPIPIPTSTNIIEPKNKHSFVYKQNNVLLSNNLSIDGSLNINNDDDDNDNNNINLININTVQTDINKKTCYASISFNTKILDKENKWVVGTGMDDYLGNTDNFGIININNGISGIYLQPNNGSWFSLSDLRLKNIIGNIDDCLNKINKINPIYFKWKQDDNQEQLMQVGVIAQEVLEVFKEAVAIPKNPEKQLYSVSYTNLIPLLIGGIQELNKLINDNHTILMNNNKLIISNNKLIFELKEITDINKQYIDLKNTELKLNIADINKQYVDLKNTELKLNIDNLDKNIINIQNEFTNKFNDINTSVNMSIKKINLCLDNLSVSVNKNDEYIAVFELIREEFDIKNNKLITETNLLIHKNKELDNKNTLLEESFSNLLKKNTILEQNNYIFENKNLSLKDDIKNLNDKNNSLEKLINDNKNIIDALSDKVNEQQKYFNIYKNKLDILQNMITTLQKKI